MIHKQCIVFAQLIKNIKKMQISPKFIIVVLFILPKLALADSVLDDTSSDIVVFNGFTLPDLPRGSKVLQPYASLQLTKDAMLGSTIRPISEVYSDANSFVDGGSIVLSAGGNLDVFVAIEPLNLSLNAPVVLSSSANTVSFTQYPMSSGLVKFNSLLISEGSNLIQSSGNASFLVWVTNQSQPVLTGNIRTSLGGTLVMSNTGGAIVTMGAGGVTAGVTASPAIIASVPEPSNFSMLAMGLLGIGLVVRRKANKH